MLAAGEKNVTLNKPTNCCYNLISSSNIRQYTDFKNCTMRTQKHEQVVEKILDNISAQCWKWYKTAQINEQVIWQMMMWRYVGQQKAICVQCH